MTYKFFSHKMLSAQRRWKLVKRFFSYLINLLKQLVTKKQKPTGKKDRFFDPLEFFSCKGSCLKNYLCSLEQELIFLFYTETVITNQNVNLREMREVINII